MADALAAGRDVVDGGGMCGRRGRCVSGGQGGAAGRNGAGGARGRGLAGGGGSRSRGRKMDARWSRGG